MMRRILGALVIVVLALPVHAEHYYSISPFPQSDQGVTMQSFLAGIDLLGEAGANAQVITKTWHELERTPGTLELEDLRGGLDYSIQKKLTPYVGIQMINTLVKDVPDDLRAVPFDDPRMLDRFTQLLTRIAPLLRGRVPYLSLGNEVDVYLEKHPEETAPLMAFLDKSIALTHVLLPGVQIGVTGTHEGLLKGRVPLLTQLNQHTDVVILTYYPSADDSGHISGPETVPADFARMLQFSGAKPLLLQEVGYPTSPLVGGSESKQAAFMENIFVAWLRAGVRIPLLNIFALHDFSPDFCASFLSYYQFGQSEIMGAFLCTLGLRDMHGQPKQAWKTIMENKLQ
jgi:hypothetical protein